MGTYLTKPVTTKESTHGECRIGERRVVYAATAVQGWRKTMEDAHSIVPHLEENTAFFAVYDGHGGSEVAEYCAKHLHELLQSSALYQSGDLGAALKEVFVECDHKVLEKEAIQEMKRYGCEGVQGEEVEESSSDEREEAAKLLEEAEMPLDTLLAQYLAGKEEEEEEGEEVERGDDTEGERQDMKANERVRFMLQELASQAGFEIEFEDTDDSEEGEEEQMDGEEEEKEEEEEEEEEGKEEEEEEKEEEEEGKGKEEEEEEEEEEGKEEKEEKEGEEEEKEEEGAREETNEGEEEKEKGKGVKEKEDEDEGEEDVKEEEREREVIGKRSAAVLEEVGGRGEGEAEELAITKRTSLKGATSIGKRRGAESPEQCVTKRAHVHSPEVTVNDTHFSVEQSREIKGHNLLEPSSDGDQKRRYGNQLKSTCRSLLEGKGHQNKRELEEGDVDPCSSSQTVSPNGCTEVCSVSTVHRSEGLAENGSTESIEKSRGRECHSSITRDAIAGTRAIAKNSSRSSKGHILVDLLTSTVDGYGHHVSQGSESEEEESEERLPLAAASPTVPVLSLSRKRHRHDEPEDLEMVMKEDSPKRLCRGRLDDEGYHSGTTAVVCLLRENTLTVANAGDSRCVLSCRGRAVDMSEDHKPTDPAELERINRAGGSVGADGRVNGGLNLSRAIGDHFYKENTSLPLDQQMITALPDIKTRELAEGDEFMVIACDGIWNTKSSQEVVDFIRSRLAERCSGEEPMGPALERICESLCDACLASDTDNDGTGCDNMTVTVALLQSPPSLLSSTNPAITQ